ncbi:lysozyme [Qipengyuania sp. 6B39]|uniref:lysozyme n=1 Tax=Qipengyuania proteolytica TaxID=2867239 RepID=UPI001C892ABD|nr:lysozyme [Qipengyuania proteolytica]MBX7496748.1 lysozyme [Qipengyuania proteolytica]
MNRKAIFDHVRRLLGRGFTPAEVEAFDDVLDSARVPVAPSAPESPFTPMRTGMAGVQLIKRFEGCARLRPDGMVEAYPDPGTGGAPWTIGWGATGPDIGPGTIWTQARCDERLEEDIARHAEDVRKALGSSLAGTSQAQFDALVSFHYNTGAIARATLTKKHKAGDFVGAAEEFARWNRAGGRVLKGLVRRRREEAELYRSGS